MRCLPSDPCTVYQLNRALHATSKKPCSLPTATPLCQKSFVIYQKGQYSIRRALHLPIRSMHSPSTQQRPVLHIKSALYAISKAPCTGWRRHIGCFIFIGHFPQKSPKTSGFFAEHELRLKVSYWSLPPCSLLQETATISNEPCSLSKEPCTLSKEPCTLYQQSPVVYCKKPRDSFDRVLVSCNRVQGSFDMVYRTLLIGCMCNDLMMRTGLFW